MQNIFKIIIKNLLTFLSKEDNLIKLTEMFIKFFYQVAEEAKENKEKQSNWELNNKITLPS